MWQIEGMRSFYRGGFLAFIKNAMTTGIFFTGLENFRHILDVENNKNKYIKSLLNIISAGSATFICTLALSPINVLKTRFEVFG
jgi:solute carrier family 25 protein 38